MENGNIVWTDFNEISNRINPWLPLEGEGDNMATQAVTAISKLVYRWFNDGDIYDNRYFLESWANDLSSYANWLYNKLDIESLKDIENIYREQEYTDLLYNIANNVFTEEYLSDLEKLPMSGSIYTEEGPFEFMEYEEEDDW